MPANSLGGGQAVTAAGQQLTFQCDPAQIVNPKTAVIFNKSPYELDIMGYLIPAWSIIPFPVAAILGGSTTLIATTLLAVGVTNTHVATIYVQWFAENEMVPDQQAFTADAIAALVTTLQGPTNYASSGSLGGGAVATLIAGGTPAQVIRVYGVWVTGANNGASAPAEVLITVHAGVPILSCQVPMATAGVNGVTSSNSLSSATGLTVATGGAAIEFVVGNGSANTTGRGGIWWSVDTP